MADLPTYVLVTPARNEAAFLARVIESVAAQTVPPLRWVIVSDGSTDGTDEIVRRYAAHHPWIELVRMPERKQRDFAGKVHAIQAGCARLAALPYEAIVNLDADVTFEPGYFEFLLTRLAEDPRLGLVGTRFIETGAEPYDYGFTNIEHVSGPCQVFRRACFDAIGGYVPSMAGAVDTIAVISARMHGWKTRTFTEQSYRHNRMMGTADRGPLVAKFRTGVKEYFIGNHPLWQIFRCAYQVTKRPYLIGALALWSGYLWTSVKRPARPVSTEFVAFNRGEQIARLKKKLLRVGLAA